MDILCPTVTYTLNPPQHGINKVIISYDRPNLFKVEFNQTGNNPNCYQIFHVEKDFCVKIMLGDQPWNNQRSTDPRWMPYKDVVVPIFERYVQDHVPQIQQLEEIYAFPVTAEDVITKLNTEIEQLIKDHLQIEDFGNGRGYFYAWYDMKIKMEERHKLMDGLKPYGLQVDFICDDLHIRVHGRPSYPLKDTVIGRAVTEYMDRWEEAQPKYHPADSIVRMTMMVIELICDQVVDRLFREDKDAFGKIWVNWYKFDCYGNTKEVVEMLLPLLEPYGLTADDGTFGEERRSTTVYIRAKQRPLDTHKDTKIGRAVDRYMDEWEPAHAAMLLAQSKLGQE
jgi:hypothetical protein